MTPEGIEHLLSCECSKCLALSDDQITRLNLKQFWKEPYARAVLLRFAEVLAAYRATQEEELAELREWKKSILSALKYVPEWEPGQWAGDKEGWGFNFEFINWMRREIEKLRATQEEDAGKMTAGLGLLVKLGSIAVHAEEIITPGRHPFDISALQTLLEDAEVKQWLAKMQKQAFLPVKR